MVENEKSKGEIFNLTYGESRPVNQIAEIIKQHFPNATIRHQARDKLMPARGTLSVDKARNLLGYNPQFPLELGFVQYVKWYKDLFKDDVVFQFVTLEA